MIYVQYLMRLGLKLCQNEKSRDKYAKKISISGRKKKSKFVQRTWKRDLNGVNWTDRKLLMSTGTELWLVASVRLKWVWTNMFKFGDGQKKNGHPLCFNPGHGARMSLMLLGCITYEGMGTLTIVNGNINASKFIDIIEKNVWPIIARHFTNNEYIYQDDNAPVHWARIVKEYINQNLMNCM